MPCPLLIKSSARFIADTLPAIAQGTYGLVFQDERAIYYAAQHIIPCPLVECRYLFGKKRLLKVTPS